MRRCAELRGCSGGRRKQQQLPHSRRPGQTMTWSSMATPVCCPPARRQPCSAAHGLPGHRRHLLLSLPPERRLHLAALLLLVSLLHRPALRLRSALLVQEESCRHQLPACSQLQRRQRFCSPRQLHLSTSLQLQRMRQSSRVQTCCCPHPLTCLHPLRSRMQQSSWQMLQRSQQRPSRLRLLRRSPVLHPPAACSMSRQAGWRSPPSRSAPATPLPPSTRCLG